jgi:hypothetical protein
MRNRQFDLSLLQYGFGLARSERRIQRNNSGPNS